MKKSYLLATLLLAVSVPVSVSATTTTLTVSQSDNGNGNSNSSQTTVVDDATDDTTGTTTQTQTQAQTNNPGTGTMTQEQTEARIQDKIQESKPEYSPKNARALERQSAVATAVQELIRTSYQIENTGIGDQIRTIAQTQNRNQDKINQAVDTAAKRTAFAKFFIGANYQELKDVKTVMEQNKLQIQELGQIMTQLTTDADKIAVANQIITLQEQQIALKDQVSDLSGGFSLFGWINRWFNKY
jgi:hypothetical protein